MQKLYPHFNFSLLDDPRFTEESVREDLIAPLIKAIGYSNNGNTKVIRNHGLKHPFVTIGSTQKPIRIIPDYLMKVDEKPAWVLEAKSPAEQVNESRHAQQAYSYAIHPEIRVDYFGLCNGREFILYNISDQKPMFHVSLQGINASFEFLKELLAPDKIFTARHFNNAKDLGLHFKRLGLAISENITFLRLRVLIVIKYTDELFSFSSPVGQDGASYMATFDFDKETAAQLLPLVGRNKMAAIMQPVTNNSFQFHFDENFFLNVRAHLPENNGMIENDREIFLPLIVAEFLI